MILNGHIACKRSRLFEYIFGKITSTASSVNNFNYSESLLQHTWTFDDALTDQLEIIYENYFKPRKLLFHFFVCPKLIDQWELGNKDYVRYQLKNHNAEMLSWDDISKLVECGNIVGSHGVDHRSFINISRNEFIDQLEYSRELIEQRTGYRASSFAFPYGHVGKSSLRASIFAKEYYDEVYLSDNSLPIGQLADGIYNRRHAEFGLCAFRGILIGAINVAFGIKKWRS